MKKKKISEFSQITDIGKTDKFLVNKSNLSLVNALDLRNKLYTEFENLCPDLSTFTKPSPWLFENGILKANNLTKFVSATSPSFTLKIGVQYTVTAFFDVLVGSGSIQPVTGSTQHTKGIYRGLNVFNFTPTNTSCVINIYGSSDTPADIELSYLRVEEGIYPSNLISLLLKDLRTIRV